MNNTNGNKAAGGLTFGTALTLIFITLKLLNIITWSWWWVLSPIWMPVLILSFVIILIILRSRR